jgi:hypothetical protein
MEAEKDKIEKLTPDQHAKLKQVMESLGSAVIGDAQSFAVEAPGGKPRITIVNQYERDVDLPGLLRTQIPALQEADKAAGVARNDVTITEANGADGSKGIRIKKVAKNEAAEEAGGQGPETVTVLQKGKVATIYISDEEVPPAPITLSATDKISEMMTIQVHLSAALQAAEGAPQSPLAMMPEEKRAQLKERLAGKEIRIGVSNNASGAMAMNLDIPVELLKVGAEFLSMVMPRPQAEPAGEAGAGGMQP